MRKGTSFKTSRLHQMRFSDVLEPGNYPRSARMLSRNQIFTEIQRNKIQDILTGWKGGETNPVRTGHDILADDAEAQNKQTKKIPRQVHLGLRKRGATLEQFSYKLTLIYYYYCLQINLFVRYAKKTEPADFCTYPNRCPFLIRIEARFLRATLKLSNFKPRPLPPKRKHCRHGSMHSPS